MAPPKKNKTTAETPSVGENTSTNSIDDFTKDLIKALNKQEGDRIAYNLGSDMSPTHIERWISTGSTQLDYIISNKRDGGLPEGRIIEIFGQTSIGKSHISYQVARSTQAMGGIVVYIDTENATSPENLAALGVNVSKRFAFVETACTEKVFQVMESSITMFRALNKDVPMLIVWDSVAATSPKAELEGDYDKETMGLQARVLSKGLRKITQLIGNKNVTLLLVNQIRMKIGTMYGDPTTTPGGMAIPFMSSVRIRLSGGSFIEVPDGSEKRAIGANIIVKIIKNKVAYPQRSCNFQIHFGKGIVEHEELFDVLRSWCDKETCVSKGKRIKIEGTGGWKYFTVADNETGEVLIEKKFFKADFKEILTNPEYKPYLDDLTEAALVIKNAAEFIGEVNENSYVEVENALVEQAARELEEK